MYECTLGKEMRKRVLETGNYSLVVRMYVGSSKAAAAAAAARGRNRQLKRILHGWSLLAPPTKHFVCTRS